MSDKSRLASGYASWLSDVKIRIQSARTAAARTINRELILLYWDIGRGIVEKQQQLDWGESVIMQLSNDLKKAFPGAKGFSDRNLRDMKRFFLAYSDTSMWRQVVATLSEPMLEQLKWRQSVAKMESTRGLRLNLFRVCPGLACMVS